MADQPPIAERVRFWQEQDRINKALIPRVVKLHKRFSEFEKRDSDMSQLLGALESKVTADRKADVDALRGELSSLAARLERRLAIFGRVLMVGATIYVAGLFFAIFK